VYPEETKLGQRFIVDAALYTDTRPAGLGDDLSLSTDYGRVCKEIERFLTTQTYRLLEAAAEHLAEYLLLTFPMVVEVGLEIKKPSAPIPLPFDFVSVEVRRGWQQAVVACGSNLGDRGGYLRQAAEKIAGDKKCRLLSSADLIETKPYGNVEQDDFLNGAFLVETLYRPKELLAFLNRLEAEAGRERLVHWGPRTLDLDLIFYEDCVMRTEELTVPHPDMHNREFVLRPVAQLVPQWVHPVFGESVSRLLERLKTISAPPLG